LASSDKIALIRRQQRITNKTNHQIMAKALTKSQIAAAIAE
jgi:DNA-binding protein HU-beta